ncbi:MAG TPA: hypothetical protein VN086_00220 [Candidatus Paceibacterota bacterium]|nr:hypothetical protein [Candidatus Paceibacterota bacterium]
MSAITGWLLIIIIGLLIWGGVTLLRSKSVTKLVLVAGNDSGHESKPDDKKKASNSKHEDAHEDKGGHAPKWAHYIGPIIAWVLGLVLILWILVSFWHWAFGPQSGIGSFNGRPRAVRSIPAPQVIYQMCPVFSMEHQTCMPTGLAEVDIPPGVDGKSICWDSPFIPDEHLQIHLMDGTWRAFKPNEESVKVSGYRWTPIPGNPRPKTYWLVDGSCLP